MAKSLSPLRYPGGKSKIYDRVKNLIMINGYNNRTLKKGEKPGNYSMRLNNR
jgi:hypothetical protein